MKRTVCSLLLVALVIGNFAFAKAQANSADPAGAATFNGVTDTDAAGTVRQERVGTDYNKCPICRIVEEDTAGRIIIDSRTADESLQQPDGARQVRTFKRKDRVTVYVTNMNPYVYTYTTTMTEEPVEEAALKQFLLSYSPLFAFLGGSEEGTAESARLSSTAAEEARKTARELMGCKELEDMISNRLAEVDTDTRKYLREYSGYQAEYVRLSRAYAALLNRMASCCSLYENSVVYSDSYLKLPDKQTFERLARNVKDPGSDDDLDSRLTELAALVNELEARVENAVPSVAKKAIADQDEIIAEANREITASRSKIRKATSEIDKINREISRASSQARKDQLAAQKKTLEDQVKDEEAKEAEAQKKVEGADTEKEKLSRGMTECTRSRFSELRARYRDAELDHIALQDKLGGLCNNLFGDNRVKIDGMAESVRIVLEQPEIFLIRKFKTGGFGGPTDVTLRLFRTDNPAAPITSDQKLANDNTKPLPCKPDDTPGGGGSTNSGNTPPGDQGNKPKEEVKPRAQNKLAKPPNDQPKEENPPPTDLNGQSEPSQDLYISSLWGVKKASYAGPDASHRLVPAMLIVSPPMALRNTSFNPSQEQQQETGEAAEEQDQTPPPPSQEVKLRFGAPRFILSGGIAFSRLEKREFQPVLGVQLDRNGMPVNPDMLTSVIGLKDSSDWTLGPLLLLSARLVEGDGFGLYGSVGITGKKTDDNTDIDYLIGPSLGVLDNRILFTGGAYIGRQVRLAGDAFIGAPIAAGTAVPTRKEYHAKFGFSVTFRVIPFK